VLAQNRADKQLVGALASFAVQSAYWVNFKVPRLTGLFEVNEDLFVLQTKLLECDVCAMSKGAAVGGVESNLVAGHDDDLLVRVRELQAWNQQ